MYSVRETIESNSGRLTTVNAPRPRDHPRFPRNSTDGRRDEFTLYGMNSNEASYQVRGNKNSFLHAATRIDQSHFLPIRKAFLRVNSSSSFRNIDQLQHLEFTDSGLDRSQFQTDRQVLSRLSRRHCEIFTKSFDFCLLGNDDDNHVSDSDMNGSRIFNDVIHLLRSRRLRFGRE